MTKQFSRFAFTLFSDVEIECIKEDLNTCTKHWVMQKEKGKESGREHYQGRIQLHDKDKKRNEKHVAKVFSGPMKHARFSIEHDKDASTFYCLKDDTKVDGPWSDGQTNQELRIEIPWDLAKITEWKPWQTDVFESFKQKDDRVVNVLYDPVGGNGKSKVIKMALWKKWAGCIPCIGDAKDIIQAVCSMGPRDAFILDLPRTGEGDKHLASQIKAIEQIKNGVVMDFRYAYKEVIFGSPVVWVFTNHTLPTHMLSADRWKIWNINPDGLLVGASL